MLVGLPAPTPAAVGAVVGSNGLQGLVIWPLIRATAHVLIPCARCVGNVRGGVVVVSASRCGPEETASAVLTIELADAIRLAAERPAAAVCLAPRPAFAGDVALPPAVRRVLIFTSEHDASLGLAPILKLSAERLQQHGRRVAVKDREDTEQ
jgi:hypothetical protein